MNKNNVLKNIYQTMFGLLQTKTSGSHDANRLFVYLTIY